MMSGDTARIETVTIEQFPKCLVRKHPEDLHWRKRPDGVKGDLQRVYRQYYPHLVDKVCLQCGAVPCPYDHEKHKDERLKDMKFIQQMAKEREQLATQCKQMEDTVQQIDENKKEWKIDRMLLKDKIKDMEKHQKEMERQRMTMEAEINRLRGLNDKQQDMLAVSRRDKEKLQVLMMRHEKLQKEHEDLKTENQKFRGMIVRQSDDLTKLEQLKTQLTEQVSSHKGEIQVLKVKLFDVTEVADTATAKLAEKDDMIKSLERKLQDILLELTHKVELFELQKLESAELVESLKKEIYNMRSELESVENRYDEYESRIKQLVAELEMLRERLRSSSRFREFVEVKREVIDLRDKNESLKTIVAEATEEAIPTLNAQCRVRVMSAKTRKRYNPQEKEHFRPSSAMLLIPK